MYLQLVNEKTGEVLTVNPETKIEKLAINLLYKWNLLYMQIAKKLKGSSHE
jgi:hypothetical protein